jgi:hypothetical protein
MTERYRRFLIRIYVCSMTRILLTPGLGNQFFQAAAALGCRRQGDTLGQVVVSGRYLSKKHGGVLLTNLPFIRGLAEVKARWMDDMAYLAWQRVGHLGGVRRSMELLGYWMESPLPWRQIYPQINYDSLSAHEVGAGYFQSVSSDVITSVIGDLIDIPSLDAMLKEQDIRAAHCIHIRAGDYQLAGIYTLLDSSYYLSAVRALVTSIGEDVRWEVVTDDPDDPRVQFIHNTLQTNGVRLAPMSRGTVVNDLLRLIGSRSLVCANSTFSVAAAYIRAYRDGGGHSPYVPKDWFNTSELKDPSFYAGNWIIN